MAVAILVIAFSSLTVVPALASDPGGAHFDGAYATDGYINAAEAAVADADGGRPVTWTDPGGADHAHGAFTDGSGVTYPEPGANCGPFDLAPTGTGGLNDTCMGFIAALQADPATPMTVKVEVTWHDAGHTAIMGDTDTLLVDTLAPASVDIDDSAVTPLKVTTPEASSGVPVFWDLDDDANDSIAITVRNDPGSVPPGCDYTPQIDGPVTGSITPACWAALVDGDVITEVSGTDVAGNPMADSDTTILDRSGPPPATGVDISPDPIGAADETAVTVSGDGTTGTTAHIDLCDDLTVCLSADEVISSPFSHTFDVSTLDEGILTATVTLEDLDRNLSSPASDTAVLDLTPPDPGTVEIVDGDGYVNASEVATGVPANWTAPAGGAASATVWFEDGAGVIPGGCGPFAVGVSGSGSLNPTCAGNMGQGLIFFKGVWEDSAGNPSAEAEDSTTKDTLVGSPFVTMDDSAVTAGKVTTPEATTTGVPVAWDLSDDADNSVSVIVKNVGDPDPPPGDPCNYTPQPDTGGAGNYLPSCWATLADGDVIAVHTGADVAGNPIEASDTTVLDRSGPAPATGVDISPDLIGAADETAVTVSGDGTTGTTAHIELCDSAATPNCVSAEEPVSSPFSHTFNATTLDDGTLTGTVRLEDVDENLSDPASDTALLDTLPPPLGTVEMLDPNGDGFMNLAEATTGCCIPANWSNPDADAAGGEVWFEDSTAAITGGCGPFAVGPSGSGNVNATCAGTMAQGLFSFKGKWFDSAGNESEVASVSLNKDTLPPGIPTILSPADSVPPPGYAPGTPVTFSGGCSSDTAQVKLFEGSTQRGPTSGCSTWSVTVPGGDLTVGLHTLVARAFDAAGNTTDSLERIIEVSQNVPIITTPTGGLHPAMVNVGGTGLPGATIEIFDVGTPDTQVGSTQVNAAGNWGVAIGFDDGAHTIKARATALTGNTSFSTPVSFAVDALRPVVSIGTANNIVFAPGSPTKIEGGGSDPGGGVVGVELKYFNVLGALVATRTAACDAFTPCGPSATPILWRDLPGLSPAVYSVQAVAIDQVGNRSNPAAIGFVRTPSP